MRILITGATGFAGKQITKRFVGKGNYILCLVRAKDKFLNSFDKDCISQLSYFEIKEPENVTVEGYRKIIEENNIDTIIHNAAIAREYSIDEEEYYKTNVLWPKTLATSFLRGNIENKNKKFIYISSVGVYGTIPTIVPAKEATQYNPDGMYHRSKQRAERELSRMKLYQNLPLVILRPSIMYGIGDYGFVYKLFKLTSKGLMISNNNRVHLLDLESFADAIEKFVEMPANIFNTINNGNFIYNISDKQPVEMKILLQYIKQEVSGNYVTLPSFVFNILKIAGKINPAISIKFKLISDTWAYDVSSIEKATNIRLNNTTENLEKYLDFYKGAIYGNK